MPDTAQTDLSALETIADDFLRWRKWMQFPAALVAGCSLLLFGLAFTSHAFEGKGFLGIHFLIPAAIISMSWEVFKRRAQKRVITQALPLIAGVSGVNCHEPDRYTSMRVKKAGRSGLFPAQKADCDYSLSCGDNNILMTMDQFTTASGHHNSNRFSGYLFKTNNSFDTPDLLIAKMGNKTDLPEKLYDPVEIGSDLFEVWYREDADKARSTLADLRPRIRQTTDHLTDGARFHGLMIRDGFLTLAVQHESPYFSFNPLTAGKAMLLKRFSSWLTICALPLHIATIWHTAPESTPGPVSRPVTAGTNDGP